MKPILSCKFNMETACVELKFLDGTMLAIDTIAAADEVAANTKQKGSEPDLPSGRPIRILFYYNVYADEGRHCFCQTIRPLMIV